MWLSYRSNRLSFNWLETRLNLLMHFHALDVIFGIWRDYRDEDKDWSEFTYAQREIIEWLEEEE